MHDDYTNDWAWLSLGPEIAIALFIGLAAYTVALLATTMRRSVPGLGWLTGHTIRRDLTVGLGLLALVPAIGLSLVLASRSADQREERAASLLYESARSVAAELDQYFDHHVTGMASLAANIQRAGRLDTISLTEWLEAHHSIYKDYLTMLAANTFGDIVTATSLVQDRPQRIAGLSHNISDRDYFITPMRDGDVYISDVFQGRGLGSDPIVAVSAAVTTPTGLRWGVIEGSLDLRVLSQLRSTRHAFDHGGELLIVDSSRRTIFSSEPVGFPILSQLPDVLLSDQEPDAAQPSQIPGASTPAHHANDSLLITTAKTKRGWQVIVTQPVQPIYAAVLREFGITLIWLMAAVLAATLLSLALARRVTTPLQTLTQAVRALDLDGVEAKIAAPHGAAGEIREVFGHLSMVSQRLHNSYRQLSAASETGRHYRDQLEQTLARREAEIASRTRELEHTNSKLRTLSNVDMLTGLANRRRFLETMDRVWRHCMREGKPVSVIIIDIDHFKAYNDTYGHQAGDQTLIQVGQALGSIVGRSLDLVARYGGEEFMMILGDTKLDDALTLAQRTRRLIEDLAIPHHGSTTDSILTLSLGAASVIPQRGSHHDELIRAADRALYHAKEHGRNRVGLTDDEGQHIFEQSDALDDGVAEIRTFLRPAIVIDD